jgi:hypothetical protein
MLGKGSSTELHALLLVFWDRVLLCSSGSSDPPALASQVLELQVCTIRPGFPVFLYPPWALSPPMLPSHCPPASTPACFSSGSSMPLLLCPSPFLCSLPSQKDFLFRSCEFHGGERCRELEGWEGCCPFLTGLCSGGQLLLTFHGLQSLVLFIYLRLNLEPCTYEVSALLLSYIPSPYFSNI